jgi:hypothetical protein
LEYESFRCWALNKYPDEFMVGNVAGDSRPEIVMIGPDDSIHVYDTFQWSVPEYRTRTLVESTPANLESVTNGRPCLCDVVGDSRKELLFARQNKGPDGYTIRALDLESGLLAALRHWPLNWPLDEFTAGYVLGPEFTDKEQILQGIRRENRLYISR